MEFAFDQLLGCSIKRLTKPKFKQEFTHFYNPNVMPSFAMLSEEEAN